MRKTLPPDGDAQFVHMREVGLTQPSRHVLLREKHLPFGPVRRAPPLEPALQRPNLAIGESAWVLSLQRLEKRLRFQPWIRADLFANLIPHFGERIGARSPRPVPLPLARQPRICKVIPCGLGVHARLHRRQFLILFCF